MPNQARQYTVAYSRSVPFLTMDMLLSGSTDRKFACPEVVGSSVLPVE